MIKEIVRMVAIALADATVGVNAQLAQFVIRDRAASITPAFTNLYARSREFENATAWSKQGSGTGSLPVVTPNFAAAPDGSLTADRVQYALNGGNALTDHSHLNAPNTTTETGPYTMSGWLKSNTGSSYTIQFRQGAVDQSIVVTPVWQRFSVTGTLVGIAQNRWVGLRGSFGLSDSADVLQWEFQYEAGAVATQNITTGATPVTVTGTPDALPPNILAVKNQADHNVEVREADNENQYPLIVVLAKADGAGPGQRWSGTQDFELDVEAALVMRGGSAALNFTNTDYYLKAMKNAVNAYLLAAGNRDTNGLRNNIAVKSAKRITLGHAQGSLLGGQVAGVMKVTFELRDQTP